MFVLNCNQLLNIQHRTPNIKNPYCIADGMISNIFWGGWKFSKGKILIDCEPDSTFGVGRSV